MLNYIWLGLLLLAVVLGGATGRMKEVTEGAFTLAADLLNTTVARATATALLMRCMQLLWVLIGSLVALVTSERRPRSS